MSAETNGWLSVGRYQLYCDEDLSAYLVRMSRDRTWVLNVL